jgi:hypothetical protein
MSGPGSGDAGVVRRAVGEYREGHSRHHGAGDETVTLQGAQRLSEHLLADACQQAAWLGEVCAVILQQSLADLNRAYRNFFQSLTGDRKAPLPGGTWTLGGLTVTRFGYGAMQLAGPGVMGPPTTTARSPSSARPQASRTPRPAVS